MPTLNWIGKEAVVNHHMQVPFRLLKDVPDLACGDPGSGNLIVQGDNLEALKALLPYYAGQVKCVYIDPPYNTGNEGWAYNDNVNSPVIRDWLGKTVGKEGETLDRHDRWLCMMYPRLALLRQFLKEDGSIWISIDDNEIAHLRLLLDEIFGANNFVATVVWQKRTSPDARLNLGPAHDFILVYAKNLIQGKTVLNKIRLSSDRSAQYKNPDNDPRGPWASVDITGQTGHATPSQFYEITTASGKKMKPPAGRCWALADATFRSLVSDGRIWFGTKGDSRPRQKKFLAESEGSNVWTWWTNVEVGHNQEATKEIDEVLNNSEAFDYPKPTRLLERVLQIATKPGDLVLDSFAGSGTTGHAVLKMNAANAVRAEDAKGAESPSEKTSAVSASSARNRHFILVEMEPKIAREVTAERVRRVAQGYTNAKGEAVAGLGGGFRYCELGEPLFDENGTIRASVKFSELARHVYFSETGEPLPRARVLNTPFLGACRGVGIYLLYNGILGDESVNGGNVLTRRTLAKLPPFEGPKVVFCAGCLLGRERLQALGITVRQTPYEIKVS